MKTFSKTAAALCAFTALTFAVPSSASPRPRRDTAAMSAMATIDQMQATLIAMQKLIDGIQARNTGGTPAPAAPAAPAGQ